MTYDFFQLEHVAIKSSEAFDVVATECEMMKRAHSESRTRRAKHGNMKNASQH